MTLARAATLDHRYGNEENQTLALPLESPTPQRSVHVCIS